MDVGEGPLELVTQLCSNKPWFVGTAPLHMNWTVELGFDIGICLSR